MDIKQKDHKATIVVRGSYVEALKMEPTLVTQFTNRDEKESSNKGMQPLWIVHQKGFDGMHCS